MTLLGIIFLMYDTFSDRADRRNSMIKKLQKKGPKKAEGKGNLAEQKKGKKKGKH